jgi:hypothetical protein
LQGGWFGLVLLDKLWRAFGLLLRMSRLPKAESGIDALVVEISTRLFLQPKEEPRLQLTNIVTTNQKKIVGGAKRVLGCTLWLRLEKLAGSFVYVPFSLSFRR